MDALEAACPRFSTSRTQSVFACWNKLTAERSSGFRSELFVPVTNGLGFLQPRMIDSYSSWSAQATLLCDYIFSKNKAKGSGIGGETLYGAGNFAVNYLLSRCLLNWHIASPRPYSLPLFADFSLSRKMHFFLFSDLSLCFELAGVG